MRGPRSTAATEATSQSTRTRRRRSTARTRTSRFRRSDNGGTSWTSKTSGVRSKHVRLRGGGECFLFITPFTMHAQTPTRLWAGGWYVWRNDRQRGQLVTDRAGDARFERQQGQRDRQTRRLTATACSWECRPRGRSAAVQRPRGTSATVWGVATPRAGYVLLGRLRPERRERRPTRPIRRSAHATSGSRSTAGRTGAAATAPGRAPCRHPVHTVVVDPANSSRLLHRPRTSASTSASTGAPTGRWRPPGSPTSRPRSSV